MDIAIGSDHRGFLHKEYLKKQYSTVNWIDVGCYSIERTDYPVYAKKVAKDISLGNVEYGVLLCGTGSGMAIAANRFSYVYAAVAWNTDVAVRIKEEDNANILVLPSDYLSDEEVLSLYKVWLCAVFKGDRYKDRIKMID